MRKCEAVFFQRCAELVYRVKVEPLERKLGGAWA